MKIYFFERDPETGIIKAGYTLNGKRHLSLVCDSESDKPYVATNERHYFNEAQTAAFREWHVSGAWSIEYYVGV